MEKNNTTKRRRVFLLLALAAALVALPALAEKVHVGKLEAEIGIRLAAEGDILEFARGDTLKGTVTDPDALGRCCRRNCPAKGDSVSLVYQGDGKFVGEWGSGGKVGRFHVGAAHIDMN